MERFGKVGLEECPGLDNRWFLASNLACIVVMTAGAHCMIGSLENLLWRERNLAVIGIQDAIVDLYK